MKLPRRTLLLLILPAIPAARAQNPPPVITVVANAFSNAPPIAPNTWIYVLGTNLAPPGDTREWQSSDFVNNTMPTQLDGVSVTVNGKKTYAFYVSPTQLNVLTPPDPMPASVNVQLTNNGVASNTLVVEAQAQSLSFFEIVSTVTGKGYVDGRHASDNTLIGPPGLFTAAPGITTPVVPGETIYVALNGFGPTNVPVVSGSVTQSGTVPLPLPVVKIGNTTVTVTDPELIGVGTYQMNITIPTNIPAGDQLITLTYNGLTTQPGLLITIQGPSPPPPTTYYVAPNGNDSWTGTLPAPNATNTDGPLATFDRARAVAQSLNKTALSQVIVQFRDGTYFLPSTEQFTSADSGSANTEIAYINYPGESPVISGGVRVQNWTNVSGNMWKTTLPASTQHFENLFYNGVRRLRPRLGATSTAPLGTYYRVAATVYLNAPAPPAAAPNANCSSYVAGSGWECYDRFQYSSTDPIVNTWKNLAPAAGNPCGQPAGNTALAGDIELVDFEQYNVSKLRVGCVDATNHLVYLTGATSINPDHAASSGFILNHRYLVENIQDELSQPGQWFLDRSTTPWTLTYLANPGENPNTDSVIIPQLTQVLVASNLQYVTFQGLTFEHDNYTIPAAGYAEPSTEVSAAVSFQNSQFITFDSSIVTETSGAGLEFISCINASSPSWCVSLNANAVTSNNTIQNGAFYDIAGTAIKIGMPGRSGDTAANIPQFITVQNNVVDGWGRAFPGSKGILQGNGHDNIYTHNDVYDGYHGAIAVCNCADLTELTNNITISFNHVYNLFQGIMNDGGSLYFETASGELLAPTGTGNKMLNNKVHDVSDASVMDSDGYGGDGLYIDDFTGLIEVENNLVYRVSGNALSFSGPRAGPNEASTIQNNIFAFARGSLINAYDPYSYSTTPPTVMFSVASNNLFYFDRNASSTPAFYVQGGCTYTGGIAYTAFEQWSTNLYWRVDGAFASDPDAFHIQPAAGADAASPCASSTSKWTFYTFAGWQKTGEDAQSVVQNPGFNNPAYPADDYSLPKGSPGVGFVLFDASQAGRSNPVINPPAVPATFPTKLFNPATDY